MASITGAGQQPLELSLTECTDPKAAATAFLNAPAPRSLNYGQMSDIYLTKMGGDLLTSRHSFVRTKDLTTLAKVLYLLPQQLAIFSDEEKVVPGSQYFPNTPSAENGWHNPLRRYWKSIPNGTCVKVSFHTELSNIAPCEGVKESDDTMRTTANNLIDITDRHFIHIRILPEGARHEIMPLLSEHLIPPLADTACSYLQGTLSLPDETIAKLVRDLEGFQFPQ